MHEEVAAPLLEKLLELSETVRLADHERNALLDREYESLQILKVLKESPFSPEGT